jgi:hypothetical protein
MWQQVLEEMRQSIVACWHAHEAYSDLTLEFRFGEPVPPTPVSQSILVRLSERTLPRTSERTSATSSPKGARAFVQERDKRRTASVTDPLVSEVLALFPGELIEGENAS